MKPLLIVLCALIVATAVHPAAAEFYRYVDKHGNVLYTDDLSKIPAEQRAKATAYVEAPAAEPAAPVQKSGDAPEAAQASGDTAGLLKEREELQAQGDALNQEYEQLMAERTHLDQEKEQAVTNDQIKAYNQKIVDFNALIQDYEKRRDAYSTQVREFNDRAANAAATPSAP